ncbi:MULTISPECIES: 30S ribosome-binding factor RbfA [Lichenihabitans]|uniref:30S ribosome-binding factor RbfA n=1 Tax=Lichenihabitans TaxID=2723776 RepID=UPI0010367F01|nr:MULTISPECIES: 30S ribosome-binding factor RbfA [Lichenihabitans]UDL94788.1 30S ribosome-binding factor RbfA [Lichenihabitans sp. PAMC28606]
MANVKQSASEPSQRMLRVGEAVRHALAEVLSRGVITDPVLDVHVISVPEVRMSPDLKLATAFVMPLGGKDLDKVLTALDKNKKLLRTELAHKINLRYAPELRFRADESFEKSSRIDAILASPEVQRDLSVLGDDDQDPA